MIQGDIVALTEMRSPDSETLFGWINTPETVRMNAPYSPVHQPGHEAWMAALGADPARVVFAIRDGTGERLLGMVQLIDLHPVHRSAELIIRIGEEGERGKGAGSEAVRLAVEYAFHDRNLQRVWLTVFADNARAIRAYEKAGLQIEGTKRRAYFIDGQWRDGLIMAVLRDHV
ncbi:GNAT family N-acetyltransferase [Minwuia sp.]|uniref:GNAT family N-acetyltransferase n=1 Tax=Minwuia sp. TaxID=2493630 RepID=UPI003A8D96E8